jgi:collagen type III alpha
MTTKYEFYYKGVLTDLGSVFQSGNSGITTNYKTSNGSDLGSQFMAGNSGILTNYETMYNGLYRDLGSIFQTKLPFIASKATKTGIAVSNIAEQPDYYYAIYTNPENTQAITYNGIDSNLKIIAVGGGGGGGGSSDGESDGGGGGGGVYQVESSLYSGISYDVYVGEGGAGGASQGGAGINSTVWRTEGGSGTYIINCLGGQPGNSTGAGSGGTVENPSGVVGNGGGGGDRGAGYDSTFPSLNLPSYLITADPSYISNNYGGGGGGAKGNSDDVSFSGGYGGGSGSTGSGSGGARGLENYMGTVGFPGAGYGGGGGAGGFTRSSTNFNGGAGASGIVIVYAEIVLPETNLPFTATGSSIYTSTSNTTGTKYCYAIFTNTDFTKTITTTKDGVQLNAIIVGGGGGGGGSTNDQSPGGGGGGGIGLYTINNITTGKTYNITVGIGGNGGQARGNATAGGISQVTGNGITWQSGGGGGGTVGGAGSGGTGEGNGGIGGDRQFPSGNSSYYYISETSKNPLGVPDVLITEQPEYISNYYSGGGGSSKGTEDDVSYGGGYGGNTIIQINGVNTSSGLGGLRGIEDNPSSTNWDGYPGESWGGGGGSGGYYTEGFGGDRFYYPGGPGKQGIVIIYSPI